MSVGDADHLAEEFRKSDPRELRDDCPSAALLWAATAGELAPEEVRTLVDHTASCVDCSVAWRVALEVHREDAPEAPGPSVLPFRSPVRRSLIPGGLTLLAAGIAAGLFFLGPWRQPSSLELEDKAERGDKRPLDSLIPPGVQPRDALVLRWNPYPGAERYSVTVMSSSLDVLFQGFDISTNELRVPPQALSTQPSKGRALWSVKAILPGGRTVDSSVFAVDFQ